MDNGPSADLLFRTSAGTWIQPSAILLRQTDTDAVDHRAGFKARPTFTCVADPVGAQEFANIRMKADTIDS